MSIRWERRSFNPPLFLDIDADAGEDAHPVENGSRTDIFALAKREREKSALQTVPFTSPINLSPY